MDQNIGLGDIVKVKDGHPESGLTMIVTATSADSNGRQVVISGVARYLRSDVELVAKMMQDR